MGSYTNYDFSETVNHVDSPIKMEQVKEVLFAYGDSQEGYGQWAGGFIMRLNDGRIILITGWCDTSGWGCQDGINWVELGSGIDGWDAEIKRQNNIMWTNMPELEKWDDTPADLNRLVRGEISTWD